MFAAITSAVRAVPTSTTFHSYRISTAVLIASVFNRRSYSSSDKPPAFSDIRDQSSNISSPPFHKGQQQTGPLQPSFGETAYAADDPLLVGAPQTSLHNHPQPRLHKQAPSKRIWYGPLYSIVSTKDGQNIDVTQGFIADLFPSPKGRFLSLDKLKHADIIANLHSRLMKEYNLEELYLYCPACRGHGECSVAGGENDRVGFLMSLAAPVSCGPITFFVEPRDNMLQTTVPKTEPDALRKILDVSPRESYIGAQHRSVFENEDKVQGEDGIDEVLESRSYNDTGEFSGQYSSTGPLFQRRR